MEMMTNIFCMLVGALCANLWWFVGLWGREIIELWILAVIVSLFILSYLIYTILELVTGYERHK